jgi:hypothetical protein
MPQSVGVGEYSLSGVSNGNLSVIGMDMEISSESANPMDISGSRPTPTEEFLSGIRSGVSGAPTSLVNGRRHDGDWVLESLAVAIEDASDRP